ncbi:hypothetical protein F383_22811 [Gossypium arboreum]|uniref:Uncharacterized protein n=1 Tax=Gossypium arboreum TaxID=29729 RepID=A0A0B0MMS4_GOSAR|nr:hypothetical protein F383_22811 [Gossypium arboreum]
MPGRVKNPEHSDLNFKYARYTQPNHKSMC